MTDLIHNALPSPRRKIIFINSHESIKKCIDTMTELDIGALVVLDNNKKLVGIVSERDIVRTCLHKCVDPGKAKVSEVVYKDVTILKSNDLVEKAMKAMTATKRGHVLICDDNNELKAILSIGDLLYHLLDAQTRVIEQLENYIHTY